MSVTETATLKVIVDGNKFVFSGYADAGKIGTTAFTAGDFGTTAPFTLFAGIAFTMNTDKIVGNSTDKFVEVTQVNKALSTWTAGGNISENNGVWKKVSAADRSNDNGNPYAFLMPKDGSSVEITLKTRASVDGAYTVNQGTYLFDFSEVSTKITLSDNVNETVAKGHDGWTYAQEQTTLTFNKYDGREIFYSSAALNVVLNGTNTITAYGVEKDSTDKDWGSRFIHAGGALTIKAGTDGGSLTVDQKTEGTYGITGGGITIGDSATGAKKVSLAINGKGNRAIWDTSSTSPISIQNADVTAYGTERAIRSNGEVTVGTGSTVKANLVVPGKDNTFGDNDFVGIKGTKLTISDEKSAVTTQGLHLEGATPFGVVNGKVIVSGDYVQNPGTKVNPIIAGLYLDNAVTATAEKNTFAVRAAPGDKDVGIFLINDAQAYNIDVKTGDKVTEKTITNASKVSEELAKADIEAVVLVTTGASGVSIDVPAGKTLFVSSSGALSGKITTGAGNGAQTIDLSGVTGQFTIEKGSVIVKDGTISAGIITVNEGDTLVLKDVTIAGDVAINGAGSVVIKAGQKVTIKNGFTLTIGADMEVYGSVEKESATGTGKLKINGQVKLMSGGSVTANVDTSVATGGDDLSYDESLMSDMTVSGVTDVGNTVFSSKNIVTVNGSWTLVAGSYVTVKGKLVVPEGATLKIEAGATLEIKNSAVFQIDGNLEIDEKDDTTGADAGCLTVTKGEAIVNGNVSISGGIVANDKVTIAQDGVLTIAATGNMVGNGFSVEASGTLEIKGTYTSAVTVKNAGSVVIDSSVPAGSMLTISNVLAGASVDVKKYTMTASATGGIEVNDADLVLTTFRDTQAKVDVDVVLSGQSNVITITPGYSIDGDKSKVDASVSGITIVSGTSTAKTDNADNAVAGIYKGKQYSKTMDISGTVSAAYAVKENQTLSTTTNANATAAVGIIATGAKVGFAVTGELSLGDNVTLTNSVGTLAVTGTVKAGEKATFTNSATVKVTKEGEVALVTKTLAGKVTATQYVTKVKDSTGKEISTNHYVDINKALAAASAEGSEIKTLTMLADQTVNADATLKDGVALDIGAKKLSINKADAEITLTIAKGATVKGSGTIDVKDTLFAEDKTNVKVTNIKSDVKTEEIGADGKAIKNGWAKWTNLTVALADAPEGSVITVTGEKVTLESNTTVKAGVTLVIPATSYMVLNSGVTLTVDGILKTDGQIYAKGGFDLTAQKVANTAASGSTSNAKYSSTVIVNGKLMSGIETVYADGSAPGSEGPALAGYDALFKSTNTGYGAPIAGAYYTEGAYYVIAGLETALKDVSVIESEILIHGKVVAGDISVKGTENLTKIVVKADATISPSITANSSLIGTALSVKSIALDGVALVVEDVATAGTTKAGYFSGSAVIGDASVAANHATGFEFFVKDSKAFVKGIVKIDSDKTDAFGIAAGTVYTDENFAVEVNDKTVSGVVTRYNAMTVASGATFTAEKASGTIEALVVDGTLSVPANKSMTVTDLTVNGTVSVDAATSTSASGTLNVTNLYIGITEKDTTGAAAAFSGPATPGTDAKILVSNDASVDDVFADVLKNLNSTVFNVNGSVWFTAYTNATTSAPAVTVKDIPVENVNLKGWADKDGKIVMDSTADNAKVLWTFKIGAYESLTAVIDTQVYKIVIKADEGIADVYLNGQAMAYGLVSSGSDYYYAYSSTVAAGSYKVTYTLKNGWSGDAKLAGDNVSGMSFSVSGSYAADKVYQLTGVEKSGYVEPVTPSEDKSDDGLTITDYLLIVLVVLIVILAVIVAMRLMRS